VPVKLTQILILTNLLVVVSSAAFAQAKSGSLQFQTEKGLVISVHNGSISVNNRRLYNLDDEGIIYASKRNKLIEDDGSTFLFLEIDGSPNRDRLYVFQISVNRVDSVVDAISSDLKDLDGDTYLEFGGADFTEVYPSRDSMYYIPSRYYEIRAGRVVFDSSCTKKMDIKENGIYLANPLGPDGFCCKVIPKPAYEKTYLVTDTSIKSERIDGPANIRDTVGGVLLFQLYDNVPVSTSDSINKWCRIGLLVDLDTSQFRSLQIQKSSRIYADGVPVGTALETVKLRRVFQSMQKLKGEMEGYTSMQNIKPVTVPEKVISHIIGQHRSFDVADLDDFIYAFRFSVSMEEHYPGLEGYYLDEASVFSELRPIRMFLAFNGRRLIAIAHRRALDFTGLKEIRLQGGYSLTVLENQDPGLIKSFISHFNGYVSQAK
jgi:hypothetical protein